MAQPIYYAFVGKFKEAWYNLSTSERDELIKKIGEAMEKVGGKQVLFCASGWSSEQWQFFGVETYPDIEAVQEHNRLLFELNWFRYIDSMTILGTEFSAPA
jgi:uncharacterized protein DUF6616